METEIKDIRNDIKKLMVDVALIRNVLLNENELSDWAKKELKTARDEEESEIVKLRKLKIPKTLFLVEVAHGAIHSLQHKAFDHLYSLLYAGNQDFFFFPAPSAEHIIHLEAAGKIASYANPES